MRALQERWHTRPRLDSRQRQGMLLVTLIYVIGWSLGRASGKLDAAEKMLERSGGPRTRRA